MTKKRCGWADKDPLYEAYHDNEWGRPVHDDQTLFEFLILEGCQAGLSWITILKKREHYRKVYDQFNPKKIARYTTAKKKALIEDPGIIRNRLKIESSVTNAQIFLAVQKEFGTFNRYIWSFVGAKTIYNKRKSMSDIPAITPEAEAMSKDLKKRGFKFVGPTICYAFMQATGMVHDHIRGCFRYQSR